MNSQDFFDLEYLRLEAYRLLADGYHRPEQNLLDGLAKLATCMEQVCSEAEKYINYILADIDRFIQTKGGTVKDRPKDGEADQPSRQTAAAAAD